MDDKFREGVARLEATLQELQPPAEAIAAVMADANQALKRAAKRKLVPEGWERVELVPNRDFTLEFTGQLLCEASWETRGNERMRIELWQTEGGAWVATTITEMASRDMISATVIEPGEDLQARRHAAMAQWDWHDRARTMVRKGLGWSLRREVA